MAEDPVVNETTDTNTSGVVISGSGDAPRPDGFEKGVNIKPPSCYRCGAILADFAEKLCDGNWYCTKCIKYFANEHLKTQKESK